MAVDTKRDVLSVGPLGQPLRFAWASDAPRSCYREATVLYADPQYVSVESSYECSAPGERPAYATSLTTLSLDRLLRARRDSPVSISKALGPSASRELEAAIRAQVEPRCLPDDDNDRLSSDTGWAITRVSAQERNTGELDRSRWRVIGLADDCHDGLFSANGEFDVPSLPSGGSLGMRTSVAEMLTVIRVAQTRSASPVVDVIPAPTGDLVAIVTQRDVVVVRKAGSSWRVERSLRWERDDHDVPIVMAEWALGPHASRWRAELEPFTGKRPGRGTTR